jgi:DNA polymerase
MATAYRELLDATIAHLEDLRRQGAKQVMVSPATLESLGAQPPVTRPPAAPAATPADASRRPLEARSPAAMKPAPAARPAPVVAPPTATMASGVQKSFDALLSGSSGPSGAPLSREAKESAMAELRNRALVCRKCEHLAASRQGVVFGVGDIHTPLMFVGEAPGADEDEQGEPFVGRAGQLLTRIILTMGFTRETVYIANILKCRPDTPGQASGNRKPTAEEMKTCLPYLLAQIDLIRPRVLVALGATAVEGLLGRVSGISRTRGQWLSFRDIPLMPTYHPAYLLRNQSLATKRQLWEDMLQVLQRLDRPITEKQRNYFLKA